MFRFKAPIPKNPESIKIISERIICSLSSKIIIQTQTRSQGIINSKNG